MYSPLPVFGVGPTLLPFATIAIAMVAITIFVLLAVLPRPRQPPLLTQLVLALCVILGGSLLLLALLYVFIDTNGTTAWTMVLLAFNFMMMFPAGFWFVSHILFEDRTIRAHGWGWPLLLATAVTGSEVLMGLLFAYATLNGATSLVHGFALGLSSVWFYWSMAAIMAALVASAPLGPIERGGSVTLALVTVAAPWVAAYPAAGGLAGAVGMAGLFLLTARQLARRGGSPAELRFLLGLSGLFLAMAVTAAGLVASGGSDAARIVFGAVMALGMVGEVGFLVRRSYQGPAADRTPVPAARPEATRPLSIEPAADGLAPSP